MPHFKLRDCSTNWKFLNKEFNYILENNDPERPGHDIKYGLDLSLIKK